MLRILASIFFGMFFNVTHRDCNTRSVMCFFFLNWFNKNKEEIPIILLDHKLSSPIVTMLQN